MKIANANIILCYCEYDLIKMIWKRKEHKIIREWKDKDHTSLLTIISYSWNLLSSSSNSLSSEHSLDKSLVSQKYDEKKEEKDIVIEVMCHGWSFQYYFLLLLSFLLVFIIIFTTAISFHNLLFAIPFSWDLSFLSNGQGLRKGEE